jgi:hypothetical protein
MGEEPRKETAAVTHYVRRIEHAENTRTGFVGRRTLAKGPQEGGECYERMRGSWGSCCS